MIKPARGLILSVCVLSGCRLSGFDAKSQFACTAPHGVLCAPMSTVYKEAREGKLPGQRHQDRKATPAAPEKPKVLKVAHTTSAKPKVGARVMPRAISSGVPIRSAPRILRVWFAPWEDADGDLHDQSYVYLPVDSGKWLIEHNRRRIQDAYRPARAPVNSAPQADQNSPIHPEKARGLLKGIEQPGNQILDNPKNRIE